MVSGSSEPGLRATMRLAIAMAAMLGAVVLAVLMSWERAGWRAAVTAAAVYGGAAILLRRALLRSPLPRFGTANMITLARAALTAVLAGVAVETWLSGPTVGNPANAASWAIAAASSIAWVLDGLDGWIARRLGLASEFGARFDMEVDALFVLALSLLAYASLKAGAWVLLAGGLRYFFVAAGALFPSLAAPLAPSFRRKAVCAMMGSGLVAATFPLVPAGINSIALGTGVVALLWSFGVDSVRLLRRPAGMISAPIGTEAETLDS